MKTKQKPISHFEMAGLICLVLLLGLAQRQAKIITFYARSSIHTQFCTIENCIRFERARAQNRGIFDIIKEKKKIERFVNGCVQFY